jgi:hypothetical protein
MALASSVVALALAERAHAATHWKLWACIHSREAAWDDPNPPYFGGLQLGWWFMRTYARRELARYGTADKWPPVIQVWVAENAYRLERYSRSWLVSQWPTTGPPCLGYA